MKFFKIAVFAVMITAMSCALVSAKDEVRQLECPTQEYDQHK